MEFDISISDFIYDLPENRIAKFPVEPRDSSKLLVHKNSQIIDSKFTRLCEYLPEKAHLVFNNTRVIPARLFFSKSTGAAIEIFLLQPISHEGIITSVMESTDQCQWNCMIGNKKKWKNEDLIIDLKIENQNLEITAKLLDYDKNIVGFSWDPRFGISFAEIVKKIGEIPLPPYLNRKTELKDLETYQTVYSKNDGAVAAPTAGLHFTETTFENLKNNSNTVDYLTLHVGAGTFQPVKVNSVTEHTMHSEQVVFTKKFIQNLLDKSEFVIPVGTTSMRSLESLYWFGVKLESNKNSTFFIEKLFPYSNAKDAIEVNKSLENILNYLNENKLEELIGETEIFIFPGYDFKICKAIITNFHQPSSTLILLIAALIGEEWKSLYDFAMKNDYRFLSYGDSSLLFRK